MEIQGSGLCSFTPLRFRQKKALKSELSAQCCGWKGTRSKINEESLQSPSGKVNLVLSTALPRMSVPTAGVRAPKGHRHTRRVFKRVTNIPGIGSLCLDYHPVNLGRG